MFIKQVIARNTAIFSRIYNHPFNQQLKAGTLPRDVFNFYLEQDALYLRDFSIALKQLSKRFTDRSYAAQFRYFADDMIAAELDIHLKYLGQNNSNTFFSAAKRRHLQKIPVISNYTNHLLYATENAPIAEAVLSCLPCFLIYKELGVQMNAYNQQNNPYYPWIASYSSKQFVTSTQRMVQTADELAAMVTGPAQRASLNKTFLQSIQFERLFFDAALIGKPSSLAERLNREFQC